MCQSSNQPQHPRHAAQHYGSSVPDYQLLGQYAPETAWRLAFRRAERSQAPRFRMAAAVVTKDAMVLGSSFNGTRDDKLASTHAELDALKAGAHLDLTGATCLVVGLNRTGSGCPWSCCPCLTCAKALAARGVAEVCYPERNLGGSWKVMVESPAAMLGRAASLEEQLADNNLIFARSGRLALPCTMEAA